MRSLAIFGATSAIAEQVGRLYAAKGDRLCLIARDEAKLKIVADDARARGARDIVEIAFDFKAIADIPALLAELKARFGVPDRALIAYGTLPDQAQCGADEAAARAALEINLLSPALLLQGLARLMSQEVSAANPNSKSRAIAVIGSVAGDRGRASNYVYGAAKGGLGLFAQGLAHRLAREGGTAPAVIVIKPGFVDTPMTAAFPKGPLWAKPDAVARMIEAALERGRSAIVYTPFFWRFILLLIRLVPQPLMHRTGL